MPKIFIGKIFTEISFNDKGKDYKNTIAVRIHFSLPSWYTCASIGMIEVAFIFIIYLHICEFRIHSFTYTHSTQTLHILCTGGVLKISGRNWGILLYPNIHRINSKLTECELFLSLCQNCPIQMSVSSHKLHSMIFVQFWWFKALKIRLSAPIQTFFQLQDITFAQVFITDCRTNFMLSINASWMRYSWINKH